MNKIEHIGIAVKQLSESIPLFEAILNSPCYKTEPVEKEQVNTAFFQTGATKIELLEPYGPGSVIHKFIEKRGEGLHHIAFQVDDINAEISRLQKQGFRFINDEPRPGADNKLVCFLLPKETNGVLIELVTDQKVP
jgi:methylmalonyl-CoA/ethylmalonyl-CoA epimerase